jgi:hypothetical protein
MTDPAAADNPTPLRWGLNDVLWGDDDTVTVLLSGPAGEPYCLELDPERAAVLREDLAGPDGEKLNTADAASQRFLRTRSTASVTELENLLRCLASPEACRWEGVYCITHSWRSDVGRCPHGQAQALLAGGGA